MATQSLTALLGFVAVLAATAVTPANALDLYTVEGYLDRAPDQVQVIGRVEVGTSKTRTRFLLVTACRTSRPACDDLDLAHGTLLRGKREDVSRLLSAPTGAAVKLTFAVYERPVTTLLIVDLGDQSA
jgi:hypothetical protein